MYILLGIVLELVSIIGTNGIYKKADTDIWLEIPNHGFKIRKEAFEEGVKIKEAEKKAVERVLFDLLLFLPGINMLHAYVLVKKNKEMIMKDPQVKEMLIPMTEEEKSMYEVTERKQKLSFLGAISTLENEYEIVEFKDGVAYVEVPDLIIIEHEPLLPLAYTLDEIKKLNAVTGYSYRVGTADGINVAIIGIPNINSSIRRILTGKSGQKYPIPYQEMSEEEAQKKTFIVYPYMTEKTKQIEKEIVEIRASRKEPRTTESASAQRPTQLVQNNILEESGMGRGPVLKKTLTYQVRK